MTGVDVSAPGIGADPTRRRYELEEMGFRRWAAVLLFRLINYWFPTIPGFAALKISERRQLV